MAYAAVSCLYYRIEYLLNSPQTSVASSTKKILRSAGRSAKRLQRTLKRYDEIKNNSEGVMGVDARIRDEACELEDAIESAASAQFLLQSDKRVLGDGRLYLNLHHLKQEIDCFAETAKKMRTEYMEELHKKQFPREGAAVSSMSENDDDGFDMVGSPRYFLDIRELVTGNHPDILSGLVQSVDITGMAGIGKTRLVKKLFHDHLVKESFDCRALVTVGQKYEFEEIMGAIIAQLNADNVIVGDEDENASHSQFFKRLVRGRKFLIVLDDVWDESFDREFTPLLPEDCDGSFVLITSRIDGTFKDERYAMCQYIMPLLNEEESWELLQKKVFCEKEDYYCPPLLEKAGKKIAEKCEGLPLLIITVAKLLSEPERKKTPEYWKEVAEMRNSVFVDAMDQIYEVIARSYHHLIQNSKACFLYMVVFPHYYVIGRSRITNLWRAERFAVGFRDIFYYLVSSSLVVVRKYRFSWFGKAKACNLHVVYRHLTKREGENIQFLHILTRHDTDCERRLKGMRRLAIYHNTLLAIKEVYNSIASVSTLRSVLCTGPYLQYQVPICSDLKLLRVLDALSIRFYEFPVELVKLIQLKYLSLTTNANLPPSINKLFFLEYLIVHQHSSIINWPTCHVYVPMEIWDLQELEHLQIAGRNLPHPPPGAILPNLLELLDVAAQTCAEEVLESIPNLEKLTVQIESAPDVAQTIGNYYFDRIFSCLGKKLKSFRTSVLNPKLLAKPRVPPQLPSFSSSSLIKLSLSGFGYPWEDMSVIAQLPALEVLKLHFFAFRGEKWKAEEMIFSSLGFLLIEDTDLAEWTARDDTFPCLEVLTMKNCYKLKDFPPLKTVYNIVLVDCNPLAETWANQTTRMVQLKNSWK